VPHVLLRWTLRCRAGSLVGDEEVLQKDEEDNAKEEEEEDEQQDEQLEEKQVAGVGDVCRVFR